MSLTFDPYIKYPDGSLFSFCRGPDKTGGKISARFDSISSYWASIVTSDFDQDVSALFVGPKGSGKSSTVLSINYHAAHKIADFVNDGSTWDDFYNLHELTACILEEDATRLMNIQRKYVIKNFDDIGIAWGARNWRDEDSIQKNDIFQINRTDNAIQTFSIPNQFLLDKVPRSLVSHYVEMDEKLFEKGFTTIKLFKPKTMFREGKIINPFLLVDRNKYVNYLIPSPPHDLWTEYKALRSKNKDIAMRRRAEDKVKNDERRKLEAEIKEAKLQNAKEREMSNEPKTSPLRNKYTMYESRFREIVPELAEMHRSTGKDIDKCLTTLCGRKGMRGSMLDYFRREKLIEKYKVVDVVS